MAHATSEWWLRRTEIFREIQIVEAVRWHNRKSKLLSNRFLGRGFQIVGNRIVGAINAVGRSAGAKIGFQIVGVIKKAAACAIGLSNIGNTGVVIVTVPVFPQTLSKFYSVCGAATVGASIK